MRANLVWLYAKKDIAKQYRASLLGFAWNFLKPFSLLAVYTLIFSHVVKLVPAGMAGGGIWDNGLFVFAGLAFWLPFSETISRATTLLNTHSPLIKKTLFPAEVLPASLSLVNLWNLLIHLGILSGGVLFLRGSISIENLFCILLLVAPFFLLLCGLAFLVAIVVAYVKDFREIILLALGIAVFFTPIFYPASLIPPKYVVIFALNPLFLMIENCRNVLLFSGSFRWDWFLASVVEAVGVFLAGLGAFNRLRRGLAEVL